MNVGIPPVVLKASRNHTATLIFLHGLGDTGMGWAGALNSIKPDYLKVICPTAPMLPVTLNGGASMPAWYDILSLDENDANREDMEGVNWAVDFVHDLVKGEAKHGLSPDRVMVGGFSQVYDINKSSFGNFFSLNLGRSSVLESSHDIPHPSGRLCSTQLLPARQAG